MKNEVDIKISREEAIILLEAIDYMELDLTNNPDLCFPEWDQERIEETTKLLESVRMKISSSIEE